MRSPTPGIVPTVADIERLVDYDRTVFDAYSRRIERDGWRGAVRDRGIAHRSFKNTLVHILNVHEAWRVIIPEKRWEIFDERGRQPSAIRSWEAYRSYRDKVWSSIDRQVEGLTASRLARRVRAPWMPGRYSMADGFVQSSYEQAHHVGEMIGAFWRRNVAPPQMMWIPSLLRLRVPVG